MKKEQEAYSSPRVKIAETKVSKVLCSSKMGDQAFGLSNDGEICDGGEL